MIRFSCKCGKKFSVEDKHAGKKGKCPQCEEVVIVPAKAANIPQQDTNRKNKADDFIDNMVSEIESDQNSNARVTMGCPYCGEEILVVANKCKHCGEFLEDDKHEKLKTKKDNKNKDSKNKMLNFHCPNCDRLLEVPISSVGEHSFCNECGCDLVVPNEKQIEWQKKEMKSSRSVAMIGFLIGMLMMNFLYPIGIGWLCTENREYNEATDCCMITLMLDSLTNMDEMQDEDLDCNPCIVFMRFSIIGNVILLLTGGFVGMGIALYLRKGDGKDEHT